MAFFSAPHKNIRTVPLHQWLRWAAGHALQDVQVALPLIQRGFVWKPNQIIALWDTLLQDMPIGALLVSEMAPGANGVTPDALRERSTTAHHGSQRLALVDGQQRTLSMLSGWPLPPGTAFTHRLWVDFADPPRSGERLRLRTTTRNQPFGFQRDDPNLKLAQSERRAAKEAWRHTPEGAGTARDALPDFTSTPPYHRLPTLALDMRDLVQAWHDCAGDAHAWSAQVLQQLKSLKMAQRIPAPACGGQPPSTAVADEWKLVGTWEQLPPTGSRSHAAVLERIHTLAEGLAHLHAAEVALLRVSPALFENTAPSETDPPLALLFKRLGSNATALSSEDYAYAILKHLRPEVHDLVNHLHGHQKDGRASVASLLSPTGLAMSTLRLAAAHCNANPKPGSSSTLPDPENPDKQAFHRLLQHSGFLEKFFVPLLHKQGPVQQWFDLVLACLDYRAAGESTNTKTDAGLPRHALPCLPRPLVQVLLRLAQIGYLGTETMPLCPARRSDVLRLVLYWWLCVHDQHKASQLAYQTIAQAVAEMQAQAPSDSAALRSHQLGQRIAQQLVEKKAGRALPSPATIAACTGLLPALVPPQQRPARVPGWSRFDATLHAGTHAAEREFWKYWCAYRHPLLLWLQRSYVALLPGDPVAGRDEDTPYDYDHIVPSAHWAGWTGAEHNHLRFMDHCENINVLGNSIGNMRVWSSSDNRSDGDTAPAYKLGLVAQHGVEEAPEKQAERLDSSKEILRNSAISETQSSLWQAHLPACNTRAAHRKWTPERCWNMETAVSQRALALYESLYNGAGFTASFAQQDRPEAATVPAAWATQHKVGAP